MFKTFGNLATLMRQASSMGGKMNGINDQLKGQRVLGTAGGGMVTVEANGLGDVLKVSIDNTLVDSRDAELMEDLCAAATNQALAKARQLHAEAMQSLTADFDMPQLTDAISKMVGNSDEES